MKIAKRSPEMRAASMRGVRLRRIDVRHAHDDVVADVHAEVLVQHVQAVDVDVDDAVVAVRSDAGVSSALRALLERRARQQARVGS